MFNQNGGPKAYLLISVLLSCYKNFVNEFYCADFNFVDSFRGKLTSKRSARKNGFFST